MTLELAPETAARLRERASKAGVDERTFASHLLDTALDLQLLPDEDETALILEGLDACLQGREGPFSEFIAEHRARYPSVP